MNLATPCRVLVSPPKPAMLRIEDCTAEAHRRGAVDLAIGTWDSPPPPFLIEAMRDLGPGVEPGYPDLRGLPELRQAIAARYDGCSSKASISADNVFITPGATGAIMASLGTMLRPGDELLTVAPSYKINLSAAIGLGAAVRTVAAVADADGHPFGGIDWPALERAITKRTKVIVLVDPDNPCGRILRADDYERLANIAAVKGLWIVIDRTYEEFALNASVQPVSDFFGSRMIFVGSISKSMRAASLRIGWLIAPRCLSDSLEISIEQMFGGVAAPIQSAVALVLKTMPLDYFSQVLSEARRCCAELHRALQRAGLEPWPVAGGIFTCLPAAALGSRNGLDAWQRLLEMGIAGVPDAAFVRPHSTGHGFVRLCFARSKTTINHAVNRLALGEHAIDRTNKERSTHVS